MEWYPRNPVHYDRKTHGLSLAEHGAYTRLIDYYYLTEAPLPDDDHALASILRVGINDWMAVADRVRKFFFLGDDGMLHQRRCDDELHVYHRDRPKAVAARRNGRLGGRPPKNPKKPTAKPTVVVGFPEAVELTDEKTHGNLQTNKQTIGISKRRYLRGANSSLYSPEFDAVREIYPKRSGSDDKRRAFHAWSARRKEGHAVAEMHQGAMRYAAWCRATGKTGTETVKQMATFFGPSDPPHFTLPWTPPAPRQMHGSSRAQTFHNAMARAREPSDVR